jgi:large subunit ribosomal protein L5
MADEKEPKEKKEGKPKGEAKAKGDAKGSAKAESKSKKGKGKDAEKSSAPAIGEAEAPARIPRLREHYDQSVRPELMKRFGYANPMQAPRLTKIVVNMGLGEAKDNVKILDHGVADLQAITGQKPVVTKAKQSIANFKIRAGMPIGAKVTLRGARMYEFLDRLVNVALPRVRDFKGVSPKSFDGRGNYALGLREQVIFPEILYDKIDKVRGMDVIVCTTARSDEEAKALLVHLGVPFRE